VAVAVTGTGEFEHVLCGLCGADDARRLFRDRDRQLNIEGRFDVVRCRNCQLVYVNPRPRQDAILRYYSGYRPAGAGGPCPSAKDRRRFRLWLRTITGNRLKVALANMNVPRWFCLERDTPGAVIDIGCGEGGVLRELSKQGWETYGIELDEQAAKRAAEVTPNVFCGQLERASLPSNRFDLAIFHHSLEHLPQPLASLREVRRVLKEGGEVLIEVPNLQSPQARVFGQRWVGWDLPRHLYHFSALTLKQMLEEAGFSDPEVWQAPAPGHFAASLQYLWNDLSGNIRGRLLWNSRILRLGFAPVAWTLTRLGWGDCLRARARR